MMKKTKNNVKYKSGDLVVLINSRKTVGKVISFEPKYIGPYEVIRRTGEANYELSDSETGKTIVAHYNRMSKFKCRDYTPRKKQPVHNNESEIITCLDDITLNFRDMAILRLIQLRNNGIRKHSEENENIPNLTINQESSQTLQEKDEQKETLKEDEDGNGAGKIDINKSGDTNETSEEKEEFRCNNCEFSTKTEKGLKIHSSKKHK